MTNRSLPHLRLGLFGFALGATVSAVGLSDFGELHGMFTFASTRLWFAFLGGVALAGIGFALHCRGGKMPRRPLQAGTIPGALVFGVGWALCGGCPGAVLVQLGEGKLAALVTLAGIVGGTHLGGRLRGTLRWDAGSCGT